MITPEEVIKELMDNITVKRGIGVFVSDMNEMLSTLYVLDSLGMNVNITENTITNGMTINTVFYSTQELFKSGLNYYLGKMGVDILNSHIVYTSPRAKGKCGLAYSTETVTEPGARNFSEILRLADLIITNHEINCYPVHVPVIDLGHQCINIKNREVVREYFNSFVAIGALVCIV